MPLSNALLKSRRITSIYFLSSQFLARSLIVFSSWVSHDLHFDSEAMLLFAYNIMSLKMVQDVEIDNVFCDLAAYAGK